MSASERARFENICTLTVVYHASMTLEMNYDDDDNGITPSQPMTTPTSWMRALDALPELPLDEDDDAVTLFLQQFNIMRAWMPDTADVQPSAVVAMFRNESRNEWLVVQLDRTGASPRLIRRIDEPDSSTVVRYYPEFCREEAYENGAGGSVIDLRELAVFSPAKQLGAYMLDALRFDRERCEAYVRDGVDMSRELTRVVEQAGRLGTILLRAVQLFGHDGILHSIVETAFTASGGVAPDAPVAWGPRVLPTPLDALHAVYQRLAMSTPRSLATLLLEHLYRVPVPHVELLEPLDWPDDYLTPTAKNVVRDRALYTNERNISTFLHAIEICILPLRAVLRDGESYAIRVGPPPSLPPIDVVDAQINEDTLNMPIVGMLLVVPEAVKLLMLIEFDGQRFLRMYTLTASTLTYDDRDVDADLVPTQGPRRYQMSTEVWNDTLRNDLSARNARAGLGLLAPLRVTLERIAAGDEHTERVFAVLGLLAFARWLAELDRDERADRLQLARNQLDNYNVGDREMIRDAKTYLFT